MSPLLGPDEYARFCAVVEAQSPRQLRRFLDYGKRARQGTGLAELQLWIGRILFDRDRVYTVDDKAAAFEVGACEWLTRRWGEVGQPGTQMLVLAGAVDKVRLFRALVRPSEAATRAALAVLFAQRYGRTWSWVRQRAAQSRAEGSDTDAPPAVAAAAAPGSWQAEDAAFVRFVEELDEVDPLPLGPGAQRLERSLAEAQERDERYRRELEAATERAERAVTRLESLQHEARQLRHDLRQAREDGDKLRDERSRRIRTERQARDAERELTRLRSEYAKLDGRLRDSIQRRGERGEAQVPDLTAIAQLPLDQLLGLPPGAANDDLAQARRRFAAAFHSDRAAQLPPWVGELFDRLLGMVNAACDRARKP